MVISARSRDICLLEEKNKCSGIDRLSKTECSRLKSAYADAENELIIHVHDSKIERVTWPSIYTSWKVGTILGQIDCQKQLKRMVFFFNRQKHYLPS